MNFDGAGNDVGLGLVHGGGHFRRDQGLVVVVEGIGDAVFLDAERNDAGGCLLYTSPSPRDS